MLVSISDKNNSIVTIFWNIGITVIVILFAHKYRIC